MGPATPAAERAPIALAATAALVLGLSAGASLTEAIVLVGWWRVLPAEEFLLWFRQNEPRLVAFYGPLQAASVLIALLAAVVASWRRHPARRPLALAALLALAVVGAFFLYFRDANAALIAGAVAPDDVPAALARWSAWHWLRTATGIGAFAAAIGAVGRTRG
jgi:branched-subunit amino acid transport protein AzlD